MQPANDGVDHINCYSKAKTTLGRLLSNFAETLFTCEDGKFTSIEGYWYWLSCEGNPDRDTLRRLSGFQAKQIGRRLCGNDYPSGAEFQRKIKAAVKAKIEQNVSIRLLLKHSTLPLTHYYTDGTKITRDTRSDWVWKYIEEVRIELKGNK